MKKTLLVLSAIATLFAFVSCGSKGDDTVDGSDGTTTNTTPSGDQTPAAEAFVLNCEAGYDNYIDLIAPVAAASGYKKINAELKYESEDGIQACIQLMDGENQASATVNLPKDYATVSGDCLAGATYNKWVNNQPQVTDCADTATRLQFYIQNSSYAPCAGKIYVKKVWLSADGKDDLVIYEFKAE